MIAESKRIEFWNFLTAEKNQAHPKGITIQRLAVIKPILISLDDLWLTVIDQYGAVNRGAAEFYQSNEEASVHSRTEFWTAVRNIIRHDEIKKNQQSQPSNPRSKARKKVFSRNRRKQF
jgi:hypothetical protein